jgi:hypothetical protein
MDMRTKTWNIRRFKEAGELQAVGRESANYKSEYRRSYPILFSENELHM